MDTKISEIKEDEREFVIVSRRYKVGYSGSHFLMKKLRSAGNQNEREGAAAAAP